MPAERALLEVMRCVRCRRVRAWTDGFPNHTEAICWRCAYTQHVADAHPYRTWRDRRQAKRRARALMKAERDVERIQRGIEQFKRDVTDLEHDIQKAGG